MKLLHAVTLLFLIGLIAVASADEDDSQNELDDDLMLTSLNPNLGDDSEGDAFDEMPGNDVKSPEDASSEDIDAKIAKVKKSITDLKEQKKVLKESGAEKLEKATAATKSSTTVSSSEQSEEERAAQKENTPTSVDSSSDIDWKSWFDSNVASSLSSEKMRDASDDDDSDDTDTDTEDESPDASSEDNWKEWYAKEVAPSLDKGNESSTSNNKDSADSSDDNWQEWYAKEVMPSLDKMNEATSSKTASSKSSTQTSTDSVTQNAIEVSKLTWRIEMSKGNILPNSTSDITSQEELDKLKKKEAELAERSKDLLIREATTSTPPPNASSKKYDREAAVAYANKFWNSKLRINHDCSQAYYLCTPYAFYGSGCSYPISHGGDTANFISQSLLAGSHPALNKGECRGVCGAEPNMRRLVNCLTTHYEWSRVCGYNAAIPDSLSAGDIIAYHDNRGCSSEPVHMALVVRVENGFAYVTSHDDDVQGQNHQFFYPKGKYVSYLHYNG